ncbi:910_t:CDS:2 [Entrophospora sp. SA101]|nr:910_t:CDS:2 [Entrophospora sp. SA101]
MGSGHSSPEVINNTRASKDVNEKYALNVMIRPIEKELEQIEEVGNAPEENNEYIGGKEKYKGREEENKDIIKRAVTKKKIDYSDNHYYRKYQPAFNSRVTTKKTSSNTNSGTIIRGKMVRRSAPVDNSRSNLSVSNRNRFRIIHDDDDEDIDSDNKEEKVDSNNQGDDNSVKKNVKRKRKNDDNKKSTPPRSTSLRPQRKATKKIINYSEQDYYRNQRRS